MTQANSPQSGADKSTKHVVQFSGGVGSWATAKRVVERHGSANVVLLFADVKDEHRDLYRFIHEGAANVGVALTVISDGRTPREVMRDEKMIGNSRFDPCSKILKRQLLDRWCNDNCDPATTVRYIGIDWSEVHRLHTFRARIAPWQVEAPLCDSPPLSKEDCKRWLEREGIELPLLYRQGFPHNNCGGACIKAGQAQWALLHKHDPALYLSWEQWEADMRTMLAERVANGGRGTADHSILRDRSGGGSKPLTLRDFRVRLETKLPFDQLEFGGCGCAL